MITHMSGEGHSGVAVHLAFKNHGKMNFWGEMSNLICVPLLMIRFVYAVFINQ